MVKNTKGRIKKLKRKLEKLEEIDQAEDRYIDRLRRHIADTEKSEAVMRQMLFKKTVGHGEHHQSQSCRACKRLRVEISRELKGG